MRVLLTGATGFVGRALVVRLLRDGHQVNALVRSRQSAAALLGPYVGLWAPGEGRGALLPVVASSDAVVCLAGARMHRGRWTGARKRTLRESRVNTVARVVEAMSTTATRPRVLLSASAVGFYGDCGAALLDEDSPRGHGFLPQLCEDWEQAALSARTLGLRVALLRLGMVLGPGGGPLGKLIPRFRAGLGGPWGSGRQWMSWVHREDLVELVAAALTDERCKGVINAASPQPVTNSEFTQALARAVGRRAVLAVPEAALRVALGEAAALVLASQRVMPRRLTELGFAFRFGRLEDALAAALGMESGTS